jgi:hypothetical protein
MAKKKIPKKKATKKITVKLPSNMPFDEAMERLVRVKPPNDGKQKDVN